MKTYAQLFIDYTNDEKNKSKTWDDFFDHANVPQPLRSDFLAASILAQSSQILEKNNENTRTCQQN